MMDSKKLERIVALIGQLEGTPREWRRAEVRIANAIADAKGIAPIDWKNYDFQEVGMDNKMMRLLIDTLGEQVSVFLTYHEVQIQMGMKRKGIDTSAIQKRVQRLSSKLSELADIPYFARKDGHAKGFYFGRKSSGNP